MRNLLKSKKGFTLVEIVIVIAIIGIMALTLIPAVSDALKSRRLSLAEEKAGKVASLMLSGIESGKIPTTEKQMDKLGLVKEDSDILITEALDDEGIDIASIVGVESMYNKPEENADLKDPMSRDVKRFQIRFNDADEEVDGAKVTKNSISILGVNPDEGTGVKQLYVTTSPLTIFTDADA